MTNGGDDKEQGDEEGGEGGDNEREGRQEGGGGTVSMAIIGQAHSKHFFLFFFVFMFLN